MSKPNELMINGYKLIGDESELYVAKSKQQVLEYYKSNYGTPSQNIGISDAEYLDQLDIYDLSSSIVHKRKKILNDDTGESDFKSYYQLYEETALEDRGCQAIVYFDM